MTSAEQQLMQGSYHAAITDALRRDIEQLQTRVTFLENSISGAIEMMEEMVDEGKLKAWDYEQIRFMLSDYGWFDGEPQEAAR